MLLRRARRAGMMRWILTKCAFSVNTQPISADVTTLSDTAGLIRDARAAGSIPAATPMPTSVVRRRTTTN